MEHTTGFNAEKFIGAQNNGNIFEAALSEIRGGRKLGHWMWFVFPQIKGLGVTETSRYFALADLDEAKAYLANEVLRKRLLEITGALLEQEGDIRSIMGDIDAMKLRSSMTLFLEAEPGNALFKAVLEKFYSGKPDGRTLHILRVERSGEHVSREDRVRVFRDTMDMIGADRSLMRSVSNSVLHTAFYAADETPTLPENPHYETKIGLSTERSFEAAARLHRELPGKRIAVLNFASATNPGGGVTEGASAQEESLCRCSTLYCCLTEPVLIEKFYDLKGINGSMYSDRCLYTPDVTVIKSDEELPKALPAEERFNVDIITCAAPNLQSPAEKTVPEKLFLLHIARAMRVLTAAARGGASVLVLGAFGCGAFRNDPKTVAKAFRAALDWFEGYFERVEFAVYCRGDELTNYNEFKKVFGNE